MVFVKDTEWGQDSEHVDEVLRDLYPDHSYKGIFIDVGANHPVWLSNSYHFEEDGWFTICIEPNPDLFETLKSKRKIVLPYAALDENKIEDLIIFNSNIENINEGHNVAGHTSIKQYYAGPKNFGNFEVKNIFPTIKKVRVECKTLNWILSTEFPEIKEIDILSIDVEKAEYAVLNGLNINKYKPKILCLEETRGTDFLEYLAPYGYIKYTTRIPLEFNTIYVLEEYFKDGVIINE